MVFWPAGGILLAAYVGLYLCRREVSLRPRRLGVFAAVVLLARLALLLVWPWAGPLDVTLACVSGVAAVALLPLGRTWLLREEAATLRQRLHEASGGLFLPYTESEPGRLVFTAKGASWRLRLGAVSRWSQLVVLPPAPTGKMALLVHWLSKQYPGPVPRVRIVLRRE
jgi:hypothetical protein